MKSQYAIVRIRDESDGKVLKKRYEVVDRAGYWSTWPCGQPLLFRSSAEALEFLNATPSLSIDVNDKLRIVRFDPVLREIKRKVVTHFSISEGDF